MSRPSPSIRITWTDPDGALRVAVLAGGPIDIGSTRHCQVLLRGARPTGPYAVILNDDDGWRIERRHPEAALVVDGRPTDWSPLGRRHRIMCGAVALTVDVDLDVNDTLGNEPTHELTDGHAAAGPSARLVQLDDGRPTAKHRLDPGSPFTVGRHPDSHLRLTRRAVSRTHARFECTHGRWRVEDLESINGTIVNGQRVDRHALAHLDRVELGDVVLRFELDGVSGVNEGPGDAPVRRPRRQVMLLAFANARPGVEAGHLRNLAAERRDLADALRPVEMAHGGRVVAESEVTVRRLFDLLDAFGPDVTVVHYGGHATAGAMQLEREDGGLAPAWATGLALRLAHLPRLRLVFLNGCATASLVKTLRAHSKACFVATHQAIDDAVARAFARRFYFALAHGATVRQSFQSAESERLSRSTSTADAWSPRMLRPAGTAPARWPWRLHLHPEALGYADWNLGRPQEAEDDPNEGRLVIDDALIRPHPRFGRQLELRVRNVGRRLVTLNRVRLMPIATVATVDAPPDAIAEAERDPTLDDPSIARTMHAVAATQPASAGPGLTGRAAPSPLPMSAPARTRSGHTSPPVGATPAARPTAPLSASSAGLASTDMPPAPPPMAAPAPMAPMVDAHRPDEPPEDARPPRPTGDPDGSYEVVIERYVDPGDYDRFRVRCDLDPSAPRLAVSIRYGGGRVAVGPVVELSRSVHGGYSRPVSRNQSRAARTPSSGEPGS